MSKALRTSISDYLYDAQIMIENSVNNEEIRNAVSLYGYNDEKLLEGKNLFEQTSDWINKHKKNYGEKFESTQEVQKAWEESDNSYIKALKVARIAFQGNIKAYNSLMLGDRRKQSLSGWLEQTQAFYKNLISDNDFLVKMEKFGYTLEKLNSEYELVKNVAQKNMKQKKDLGNAQEATVLRDKKIDELEKWIADFRSILKIALDNNPQKLEKVGITVTSSGGRKKKTKNGANGETVSEEKTKA